MMLLKLVIDNEYCIIQLTGVKTGSAAHENLNWDSRTL